MNRDRFFCGLFILAAANGLAGAAVRAVVAHGWSDALLGTFSINAVVWIACFAALASLYGSKVEDVVTPSDALIGLGVLAMTILPFAKLSWLALTALSLYVLYVSAARSMRRRGALIALAITGPTLWGPALMDVFGPAILQADATLVSNLIGTDHVGNVFSSAVERANVSAHSFAIGPPCSSLHGISIAILAWITISNTLGGPWSAKNLVWGLLAALSVLAVNVARLCLIGLYPAYYPSIHGQPGSDIAGWLSLSLIIAICLLGVRREAFVRG